MWPLHICNNREDSFGQAYKNTHKGAPLYLWNLWFPVSAKMSNDVILLICCQYVQLTDLFSSHILWSFLIYWIKIYYDFSFSALTLSSLWRHRRSHTGEKPYECEQCGQQYADSKRLRDHMYKHNNVKPFMCHKCGYTCRRKDNLQVCYSASIA